MTTMKPCPKCHSTEHLHIGINDDYLNRTLSAIVVCKECNIYAQRDYVLTGPLAKACRPSDLQLTLDVIRQWNETCDDLRPKTTYFDEKIEAICAWNIRRDNDYR